MSLYNTVPILGQNALYSSFILLQNLEDHVNAAKSCSEIIQMIKIFWKKAVHPNHFLVFRLWDKFYFTSHKVPELLEYILCMDRDGYGHRLCIAQCTGSCKKIPACLNLPVLFLPTHIGSQCTANQP